MCDCNNKKEQEERIPTFDEVMDVIQNKARIIRTGAEEIRGLKEGLEHIKTVKGTWPKEEPKKLEPSELLNKTVRFKLKAKDKGVLTVVAVYGSGYKNYEMSEHNIRVKNSKGTTWTCHSDEVYVVEEIKGYAYVSNKGIITHFTSEEAGNKEIKIRRHDLHEAERARDRRLVSSGGTMLPWHPANRAVESLTNMQLTRRPEFDISYGEKSHEE